MSTNWKPIPDADRALRVRYWTESMESARRLLDEMARYPVKECGEGFASIPDAATDAKAEMMFSNTKQAGKFERLFFVRKSIIGDLVRAAKEMNERGWILKIEDGYRTQEMQTLAARRPEVFDGVVKMCAWECGGKTPPVDLVLQRWKVLAANYPCNGTISSARRWMSLYIVATRVAKFGAARRFRCRASWRRWIVHS